METVEAQRLTVAPAWVEEHCVVPDGFRKGAPFGLYDYQLRYLAAFYLVRGDARWDPEDPVLAPAFVYRRGLLVGPQKLGKGPHTAAHICLEGVGPALFAGWAGRDDGYACADHGCPCGWEFPYRRGEPMGMRWPTPLIQITAVSAEQTDNIYDALRPMIEEGRLSDLIRRTGEDFVRLPGGGRIDTVTSSAQSRLGQRVTFVPQDEAMDLHTSLPTPTGWTTMGDVRVGDYLIGSNGRPVPVGAVTEVQHDKPCYRVHFADGTSAVASDGHLWFTRIAGSAAKAAVRTTGKMFDAPKHYTFRVPAAAPFELPEAALPVHPYFLGLWLGDGATGKAEIAAGAEDVDEIQSLLQQVGVRTERTRWAGAGAYSLLFSAKVGFQSAGRPAVAKALQVMPCYRGKHIPEDYFRGSRQQREALLQGLMDSDGHVTVTGFCTFTGNERLAGDVVRLLRTLGIHARPVSRADHRARTGFGWKVNFTARAGVRPFRLTRKAARVRAAWSGNDWVTITRIEPVESVPVRCVGVASEDHLFLAGDGAHVTHNCGLWTSTNKMTKVADTQYRGLAGMGGRASLTTNAWDPAENSVAQQQYESSAMDVYRQFTQAPKGLSYRNKQERRKIHRVVYEDALRDRGGHIDLDGIEAEAADLLERDPGQAERFFGNRIVRGIGAWLPDGLWPLLPEWLPPAPDGTAVSAAFDGSENSDFSVIRCETVEGYLFTPRYGPDRRPTIWNPAEWGGRIPRDQVDIAWAEIDDRYRLERAYCDPGFHDETSWESEIEAWAVRFGAERFVQWPTNQLGRMYSALVRFVADLKTGVITYDGCPVTGVHMGNARKIAKTADRYVLGKPSPAQKIDAAVTSVIAHEAAADARAEGWSAAPPDRRVIVYR